VVGAADAFEALEVSPERPLVRCAHPLGRSVELMGPQRRDGRVHVDLAGLGRIGAGQAEELQAVERLADPTVGSGGVAEAE
jgi:hypothetical protein